MKERGIIFSAPMVRAILQGTKTQTRRVLKRQPSEHHWQSLPGHQLKQSQMETIDGRTAVKFMHAIPQNPRWDDATGWVCCPYGQPGDRLWVRETIDHDYERGHFYKATGLYVGPLVDYECEPAPAIGLPCRAIPSIHMPRWASRITLEITGMRVERLQDISEADAEAEGVQPAECCHAHYHGFCQLWESINGPGSWDANPWVWVIEFKRLTS